MDVLATAISRVAGEAAREALDAAACYANALEAQINRLNAGLAEQRKWIKALERRPDLRYRGIWHADEQYGENDLTTHDGSLWIALRSTTTRPPSSDWKLTCRRGQNGRDADGVRRPDRGDDQ